MTHHGDPEHHNEGHGGETDHDDGHGPGREEVLAVGLRLRGILLGAHNDKVTVLGIDHEVCAAKHVRVVALPRLPVLSTVSSRS